MPSAYPAFAMNKTAPQLPLARRFAPSARKASPDELFCTRLVSNMIPKQLFLLLLRPLGAAGVLTPKGWKGPERER